MAGGRPEKYKDELALTILTEIATTSKSLRTICKENSLAVSTLLIWLRDDKEFSTQYARAKEAQADLFAEEVIEIADTELIGKKTRTKIENIQGENGEKIAFETEQEVTEGDNTERAKIKIDARKWAAAHLRPKKYGKQQPTTGDDTPPVSIEEFIDKIDKI